MTTVSCQVLVNGEPTRSFNPKCGLRQGDPLCPYLFILCMDVFSALLHRAKHQRLIQGISVCRGASPISHLFFAYDYLLFFWVSLEVCDQVISVIAKFSSLSGQGINYQKSFLKLSPNTPQVSVTTYRPLYVLVNVLLLVLTWVFRLTFSLEVFFFVWPC